LHRKNKYIPEKEKKVGRLESSLWTLARLWLWHAYNLGFETMVEFSASVNLAIRVYSHARLMVVRVVNERQT